MYTRIASARLWLFAHLYAEYVYVYLDIDIKMPSLVNRSRPIQRNLHGGSGSALLKTRCAKPDTSMRVKLDVSQTQLRT